jgi:hypothetical protein
MRFLLLILLIAVPDLVSAQQKKSSVHFFVNEAHSGLHTGVDFRYSLSSKFTFYGGIHYLGNRVITDNQYYSYKHRFYARTAAEHFGVRLGGERQFALMRSCIKPFVFVQVQQTRASLRRNSQLVRSDTINSPQQIVVYYAYEDYSYTQKPVLSLESTFGAGLIADLTERIALKLSCGLSIPVLIDPNMNRYTWDGFSSLAEAGLIWRFGKTVE